MMKTATKLVKFTPYVVSGFDKKLAKSKKAITYREYRYINFNVKRESGSPIVVNHSAQRATNQVYFSSKKQAQEFLKNFNKDNFNFVIKAYKGTQKNAYFESVTTVYGNCLRVANI